MRASLKKNMNELRDCERKIGFEDPTQIQKDSRYQQKGNGSTTWTDLNASTKTDSAIVRS